MSFYKKLKEYQETTKENGITVNCVVFDYMKDVEYYYEGKTFRPNGMWGNRDDFLLEYYVVSIMPMYEIIDNRIHPYLRIYLKKEI